jgi:hypothetical protein
MARLIDIKPLSRPLASLICGSQPDLGQPCHTVTADVHPKIVQERLGHASITTTLDLYSHVSNTMQADAAAWLDAAFQPAIKLIKEAK